MRKRSARFLFTIFAAFAVAAVLAACGSSSDDKSSSSGGGASANAPNKGFSGEQAVDIKGFAFNPATITVPKGTKVTWTNSDSASHTATAKGTFDTGTLTKGKTGSVTLDTPGTFDYI